jgi:hypothetical protein
MDIPHSFVCQPLFSSKDVYRRIEVTVEVLRELNESGGYFVSVVESYLSDLVSNVAKLVEISMESMPSDKSNCLNWFTLLVLQLLVAKLCSPAFVISSFCKPAFVKLTWEFSV